MRANTLTLDRHVDSFARRRSREEGETLCDDGMETRYQKHPRLMVHYLRLARLLRISPGETSVLSTFRFIRFHNRPESVIERKQRRMATRRKEKVRGGGRKPREALAAESLWPFSSSALGALFFVRSCKVFLAGILPRDSAGALAPVTRPQQFGIISIYRFVALSFAGLLLHTLGL